MPKIAWASGELTTPACQMPARNIWTKTPSEMKMAKTLWIRAKTVCMVVLL